jgi:hypothetical protein
VDIEQLSVIVALLAALSVAAERLVDIVKNLFPTYLAEEQKIVQGGNVAAEDVGKIDPKKEGFRKVVLQVLPIVASIVTVMLAWPAVAGSVPGAPPGGWWTSVSGIATIIATGVLVSGGSGFWNKVVGYIGEVRDLKQGQKVQALTDALQQAATDPPDPDVQQKIEKKIIALP